ncbi:hypothetical protein P154DRAFT_622840 [Amniculicola lignicola CBS 123094]|uniref:Uncharacterized protein n=1 Tax=Amniculicola lignicola CBS 123094 TaxID=1392246 RepID=A0A6A5W5B7_9PLEO|nr:hypothetical protein P154DRAFT_622840 [Amniculicola lignicola CBS 123094]
MSSLYNWMTSTEVRPRCIIPQNRVDIDHSLLKWYSPVLGDIPQLSSSPFLPLRTKVEKSVLLEMGMFHSLYMDQRHAYYEEFLEIPGGTINGFDSPFPNTKHWYVIHPLGRLEVEVLESRVLDSMKKQIEETDVIYTGTGEQLLKFKVVRFETLEEVDKELARRGNKEIGDLDGYCGDWDLVTSDDGDDNITTRDEVDGVIITHKDANPLGKSKDSTKLSIGGKKLEKKQPKRKNTASEDAIQETIAKIVQEVRDMEIDEESWEIVNSEEYES